MRKLAWLSIPLLPACLFALGGSPSVFNAPLNYVLSHWWIFPFSSSIASVSLLIAGLLVRKRVPVCLPRRLLSGAYLMVGPSLASLSFSAYLGVASPQWLGLVTPALLPMSAWAYYRSLGPSEEDGDDFTGKAKQEGDKNWGKSFAASFDDGCLSLNGNGSTSSPVKVPNGGVTQGSRK